MEFREIVINRLKERLASLKKDSKNFKSRYWNDEELYLNYETIGIRHLPEYIENHMEEFSNETLLSIFEYIVETEQSFAFNGF